jgi:hypothetical protein
LYSSRYSRKDFTLWQHIALIALMQRIRKSYREYTYDFLTVADKLLEAIGLSKIPHFTTIEKFMLRIPSMLLERVIGGFILLTRVNKEAVICSRLIRIFIAPCLYILCLEDKERCLIIDEEAGEVEGVDSPKGVPVKLEGSHLGHLLSPFRGEEHTGQSPLIP